MKLNRRIAALKPSATMAVAGRAIEMKAAGIDVISLAAGEPDFDTPERIKEAARRALAAGKTKYTPVGGLQELKEAIAFKLKRYNGLDYEAAEILASAGGKQAAANVIASLFDEGDEVLLLTPAWVSFPAMVRLAGAEPVELRCRQERGFLLNPGDLARAINPRTRGIVINSPANPTGAVYGAEELAAIARVLRDAPQVWVLSDDVYEHITYDGPAPHILHLDPQLRSRTIVLNSVSKTYAMTGWRLGFAAGPREVIAAATRLQGQNSGNPVSVSQFAAIEAFRGPQDEIGVMVEEFRKRRDLVVERIRALAGFALPNVPRGAFYAFPDVSKLLGLSYQDRRVADSNDLAEFLLEEAKVATVAGNDFGAADHLRLSYATSAENLERAFDNIEKALRKLG